MKQVLLSTILLFVTTLTFAQVSIRAQRGFEALKNSTKGDSWTISDESILRSRTTSPFLQTLDGQVDDDLKNQPNSSTWYTIFDLCNNNLEGTIEDDMFYMEKITLDDGTVVPLTNHGVFMFKRRSYFRFSHNKITAVNSPHFGHLFRLRRYTEEVLLDNNLLTEVNFKITENANMYDGVHRVTLHQNDITFLNKQSFGYKSESKCWLSRKLELLRIDNNRLGFNSLITIKDLHYEQSFVKNVPYNPGFANSKFDCSPQKPLGGDATEITLASGSSHDFEFSLTHPNNVYSWVLNGKDIPSSVGKNYDIIVDEASAGVYQCKITNPGLPEVTLYSYDMAVFMDKAGNNSVTDINFVGIPVIDNFPEAAIIGDFSATDPDGDDIFYRLPDKKADNSHFRMINGKTLISAETLFDRDYIEDYKIVVEAYDIYGGKFEKEVTIAKGVSTGTPLPTKFTLSNNSLTENISEFAIGNINLEGVDASHGYTLSLPSGIADNDLFEITGTSLKNKESFNFEAKNELTVRVKATATDGTAISNDLFINVTNINDTPYDMQLSSSSLNTNTSLGSLVTYMIALDEDVADKAFTFSFTDGYPDNGYFTMVENTLVVKKVVKNPTTLNIGVTVTDPHNATFSKEFSISYVGDVDEGNRAPRMIGLTNMIITEGMSIGDKFSDIVLSDPDGDVGSFTVTSDYLEVRGSNLYIKALPTERFNVTIVASDDVNEISSDFTFYVATDKDTDVISLKSTNIKVYPNPTKSMLYIKGIEGATYSIVNSVGYTVLTSLDNQIDISSLINGYYILKINTGDQVITKKIIKN